MVVRVVDLMREVEANLGRELVLRRVESELSFRVEVALEVVGLTEAELVARGVDLMREDDLVL